MSTSTKPLAKHPDLQKKIKLRMWISQHDNCSGSTAEKNERLEPKESVFIHIQQLEQKPAVFGSNVPFLSAVEPLVFHLLPFLCQTHCRKIVLKTTTEKRQCIAQLIFFQITVR